MGVEKVQKQFERDDRNRPFKAIANIAGKAKDFAKDILSLLVKGGILFALYKLLEFLSEQDPKKLLEDAKNAYNKFLENYGGWVTAVEDIARTALLWSLRRLVEGRKRSKTFMEFIIRCVF